MRFISDLPRPEHLTRMWRVQQIMGRAFWATVLAVAVLASCVPQQAMAQGLSEKTEACQWGAIGAGTVAEGRVKEKSFAEWQAAQAEALAELDPFTRHVFTEAARFGFANSGRDPLTVASIFYKNCLTWGAA